MSQTEKEGGYLIQLDQIVIMPTPASIEVWPAIVLTRCTVDNILIDQPEIEEFYC